MPEILSKQEIFKLMDELVGSKPEAIVEALRGLAYAANETSMHVAENWQDHKAARAWGKISIKVANLAEQVKDLLPF